MFEPIELTKAQWKLVTSVLSNMSQAVILFSLAAFFVPTVVNLPENFSSLTALGFLGEGLIALTVRVIITKEGN